MYGVFTLCYALGAAYSVYSIERQFNFANGSGMLSCHKLMVICAQLQSFRLTYLYLTSEAALLRPLLLTGTASAFTYFIFRQKLHSILTRAGLDESNIKGHSFRGGGATWLSHIGVPVEQDKVIGYWFRDAVQRYIDPHFLNY